MNSSSVLPWPLCRHIVSGVRLASRHAGSAWLAKVARAMRADDLASAVQCHLLQQNYIKVPTCLRVARGPYLASWQSLSTQRLSLLHLCHTLPFCVPVLIALPGSSGMLWWLAARSVTTKPPRIKQRRSQPPRAGPVHIIFLCLHCKKVR